MNQKWKLLLSRLSIAASEEILKGTITSSTYIKNQDILELGVSFDTPISYSDAHVLFNGIKQSAVKIKLKITNHSEPSPLRLYNYLSEFYSQNQLPQFKSIIDLNKVSGFNKEISIETTAKGVCESIKRLEGKLIEWLSSYGLNYESVKCTVNEEHLEALSKAKVEIVQKAKSNLAQQVQKEISSPYAELNQIKGKPMRMADFETPANVTVIGQIFSKEIRHFQKTDKHLGMFSITDHTSSTNVKMWCDKAGEKKPYGQPVNIVKEYIDDFQEGDWIKVQGKLDFERFGTGNEMSITANKVLKIPNPIPEREDDVEEKRVELQVHTKMTVMDGVRDAKDYVNQAKKWGWDAIAITDRYSAQSFPAAQKAAGKDIKVIYGVEFNMIEDTQEAVWNVQDRSLKDDTYVIFDLETTGLNPKTEEIIEFGGIKVQNGTIIDRLQLFIKPIKPIPYFITQITSITDEMVENSPMLKDCIGQIRDFIGDSTVVAHNAKFDYSFMDVSWKRFGYGAFPNPVIDTLQISRAIHGDTKRHRLGNLAKRYKVKYDSDVAHRADYDAEILNHVFSAMLGEMQENHGITNQKDINPNIQTRSSKEKAFGYDMVAYAKNTDGLKNLFHLVSISHTDQFFGSPKLMRSTVEKYRDNLLITNGAGHYSEIFETASNGEQEELENKIKFYDFITVAPVSGYSTLWQTENMKKLEVEKTLKRIIITTNDMNRICVGSSNAYYISKTDKVFRDIYISTKGIGGRPNRLFDYKGRVKTNPDSHLRTTKELLKEFAFVGTQLAAKIVIDNSRMMAALIQSVKPIKPDLYTPKIDGVEDNLTKLCYKTARDMYGEELPPIVEARLKKELDSIIGNGFSVVYWISHKLVEKSLQDGYLVGSRGSVGSSFVATVSNISEVNPLEPHYVCPECKYSEWINPETNKAYEYDVDSGYDLPHKKCPKCNADLRGEGQHIPFETFLGFKGDKVPDIDLNFSGEYQARAHDFTKTMFGEKYVLRAGTISTVAQKTAFGYVKNYEETRGLTLPKAEIERLAKGCEGVKRTTGQHPGGIIVIPKEYEPEEFTPRNYPADDINSNWQTTHFAFEAIHDNLLKLDILGHVDPTAIRMLQDITGVEPKSIPFQDEKVLSLFSSAEHLGLQGAKTILGETTGAIGLPEFGTKFVREMLRDTEPASFADLVRVSGLSHGTDVWLGNAKELIKNHGWKLNNVIGCRDDIMVDLIKKGLDSSMAFKIMEDVRKGKGLLPEYKQAMKENDVDDLYIESCEKIKYMFPKAHATAYVIMAWRVTWFKVHYPLEYYATFFSLRSDAVDIAVMKAGKEAIEQKYDELKKTEKNLLTVKDKALISTLELAYEMYLRGYKIQNLNLNLSQATRWTIVDGKLYPPFTALDGLGDAAAQSVVKAREEKDFSTIQDLKDRTQVSKTHIEKFKELGVTSHLSEKNQISLFEGF